LGRIELHTSDYFSQSKLSDNFLNRNWNPTTFIEVVKALLGNPPVFTVDHRFVFLYHLNWYNGRSALMSSAASDKGYLTAERSPIHGVGKMVTRFANR
jgi:hypothetical protein